LILVDTNIFLEVLLGRKKADECAQLLNRMSSGEVEGVVTRFSVHAIEAMLGDKSEEKLTAFLRGLEQTHRLTVHDTSTEDEVAVSLLKGKIGRDFDDSLQFYVAKKLGAQSIVSFDGDFDGLDIPRREPKDIVEL
jgi:predicted nucleic acid-binding protein